MAKRNHKGRKWSWFLAALFLFPYVTQSVHAYLHADSCVAAYACAHDDAAKPQDAEGERHDPGSCPVCQFHLASYTQQAELYSAYMPPCRELERGEPHPPEHVGTLFHTLSRGPPVRSGFPGA